MEGFESKSITKSVKGKCKYCMCRSYDVRACEVKSSITKLEEVLEPTIGSEVQLKK